MHARLHPLFVPLAGLATVFAACAFPQFEYEEEDDNGGGAATASASGGSAGGVTSTGGEDATSTGGNGNGGQAPCDLYADNCPVGQKCALADEGAGVSGGTECVMAGPRPAWSRCSAHAECDRGLLCDAETGVCRPLCMNANDCPDTAATCRAVPQIDGGGDIPGVKFCSAHCHPMSGSPCNNQYGATTCYYRTEEGETDCSASKNVAFPYDCESKYDCKKGTLCVTDDSGSFCSIVCTPPGQQAECPTAWSCTHLETTLLHDGTTYGVCYY